MSAVSTRRSFVRPGIFNSVVNLVRQNTPEDVAANRPTQETLKFGGISTILFVISLLAIGIIFGTNLTTIFMDVVSFIRGDISRFTGNEHASLFASSQTIIGVILLNLFVSIGANAFVTKVLGAPKTYEMEAMEKILDLGPLPLFVVVLGEELFARLLPGGIGQYFRSHLLTWGLLMAFNLAWAAIHVKNFADKKERSIFRTLPQLCSGFFIGYLYLRYGFEAGLTAHFIFNCIVLSSRKEQMPTVGYFAGAAFYAGIAIISLVIMSFTGNGIWDLFIWFETNNLVPVEGFGIFDYLVNLVFVGAIANVVAKLFLLDEQDWVEGRNPLAVVALVTVFMQVMNYGLSWIFDSALTRAVLIAVILALCTPTTSGSMLARRMVVYLPVVILAVSISTVLGVITGSIFFIIAFAIGLAVENVENHLSN